MNFPLLSLWLKNAVRDKSLFQSQIVLDIFQWKRGIPVEVIPMAYVPVMKKMELLGLKPVLRMAKAKAVSMNLFSGSFTCCQATNIYIVIVMFSYN